MYIPFFNIELNWGRKEKIIENLAPKTEEPKEDYHINLPTEGGRQSQPSVVDLLALLVDTAITVRPDYPIELIKALEYLAMYNADLSYAIDNIVQLGSTEITYKFDDDIPDEQVAEMTKFLNYNYKIWYNGGLRSLINDLLAQVAVTGALSAECVPNLSLNNLDQIILVNPSSIRFAYSRDTGRYYPYQTIVNVIPRNQLDAVDALKNIGLIKLNPITYKYYAIRRFSEKPYAIPPMLAALESIAIEKDMIDNLRSVMKRVGLFGFMEVLINKPKINDGETPAQYEQRVKGYMTASVQGVKESMNNGFVLGVKGDVEFNMAGTPSNAAGAKEIFDLNTQIKMSGLKQDPLLLGKQFTTSEALARVLLAKLGMNIANYQRLVAEFLEDSNLLALNLYGFTAPGGLPITKACVTFDKSALGDQVKEEQASQIKIANNKTLYNDGIISLQTYANNVGYDEPDQDEPRYTPPQNPNNTDNTSKGSGSTNPSDSKDDGSDVSANSFVEASPEYLADIIQAYQEELTQGLPEFQYSPGGHTHEIGVGMERMYFADHYKLSKFTELMGKYFGDYFDDTVKVYSKAATASAARIAKLLFKFNAKTPLSHITDAVLSSLYTNWKTDFSKPQQKVIQKWVTEAYREFRQDKSVFGGKDKFKIDGKETVVPKSTFTVKDIRTIEHYKQSDSLYLGRFITDADTKKKIVNFIKTEYLNGQLPLDNKNLIDTFRDKFKNVLVDEDWKIARVLNTTISNMKDTAGIFYMEQAGVVKMQRLEIIDSKTCAWCVSMNGRTFDVKIAADRMTKFATADATTIKEVKPFITSIYKDPAELANLSDADIQGSGVEVGALHPFCRGTSIAVLD